MTAAIADVHLKSCREFATKFGALSRIAGDLKKVDDETAWRLLEAICELHFQPDNAHEPFGPLAEFPGGRRTFLPCDVDEPVAQALAELATSLNAPDLKARLRDVAWERLRMVGPAKLAVRDYIDAARALASSNQDGWIEAIERYERALRLAARLRDSDLLATTLSDVASDLARIEHHERGYETIRLTELLVEFSYETSFDLAAVADRAGMEAERAGDFELARQHYKNAVSLLRRAKNNEKELNALEPSQSVL